MKKFITKHNNPSVQPFSEEKYGNTPEERFRGIFLVNPKTRANPKKVITP